MARDSMQPWLDRISYGELETSGASPRSVVGGWDWDGGSGSTGSRAYGRSENQDIQAIPAMNDKAVSSDSDEVVDDFDSWIASY
ncbi:hypothetical protein [Pyxidicoccus xibeiensis]|uniref:hypothetical protein n=1 Tax=Pyxidicoccus xibeiensis TaxID=2906759 RepID=UPI0020A752B1|nr:hypothetical protein [Pyxidicoccus xibeiensis]MCP3144653.1 hypothetical protein [Pyxidicoccus xibeiensis]